MHSRGVLSIRTRVMLDLWKSLKKSERHVSLSISMKSTDFASRSHFPPINDFFFYHTVPYVEFPHSRALVAFQPPWSRVPIRVGRDGLSFLY
jgi:hypothetical protein